MKVSRQENSSHLIDRFNQRDKEAFGSVYNQLYKELYLYARTIFMETGEMPEDIIQDLFVRVWDARDVQFDSLLKIKAFMFISIKNAYKNHMKHLDHKDRYQEHNDQLALYDIFECEAYIKLQEALGILPQDCAIVIKMYLEGYKPDEIANHLNYKPQTIYNKKQEAILRLRKQLNKMEGFILFLIS